MDSFIGDFFSFRTMVSSWIVRIIYVLGVVALILAGIQQLFSNPIAGLGLIILGNLFWRIVCEALILLFAIHHELIKIARNFKA